MLNVMFYNSVLFITLYMIISNYISLILQGQVRTG